MLDSMDAGLLAEWMAYDKIQEENVERERLKAKAEAGVQNHKRRGGR